MEKINIGLSKEESKNLSNFLTKLLASTYALYLKTQNFHWNIKGKEFFALHLMFEKQYEELAETVDEMAERIRALGYPAEASFEAYGKLSIIKGEKPTLEVNEMLKILLKDHETLICYLRENLPYSEKVHDGATADFINKRLATHEKVAWMLRSQL